jgi:hypothetical protein
MKVLLASMTVVLSLAVCTAFAVAAGDKDKGGKDSGGNGAGPSLNSGNQNKNQSGNQNQGQSGNSNKNQTDKGNMSGNSGSGSGSSSVIKKGPNSESGKKQMGDSNWDKNGIGSMDESKHKGEKDNQWRYQHMGNNWWYWMPGGYWSYWRYGHWNRYNSDNYVDVGSAPSNGSGYGPYYEDENGFYHLDGNRKVYDQQIQRVATPGGSGPSAPTG